MSIEYLQRHGKFIVDQWRHPYDKPVLDSPFVESPRVPVIAYYTMTMDRLEYTKRMITSMQENCRLPYVHFFLDNGSEPDTVDYLRELEIGGNCVEHCVLLFDRNMGLSVGNNVALDLISEFYPDVPYINRIENDAEILSCGIDEVLVNISKRLKDRFVLSPFIDGLRENKGGTPRYAHNVVRLEDGTEYQLGLTTHVGGIYCFGPADLHQEIRFDETDRLCGVQDSYFTYNAQTRGYKVAYVEDISIMHMDTTQGQREKFPEYFKKHDGYDTVVTLEEAIKDEG